MPIVLIDANIYLDFYRADLNKYKKLLESLVQLEAFIFVTDVVKLEVERNRLSVYRETFNCERKGPALGLSKIRPHFPGASSEAEALNEKLREFSKDVDKRYRKILEEFQGAHNDNLRAILRGVDDVSEALSDIFDKSVVEEDGQFLRARRRKDKGLPPGKKGDPIGDELTWEQLLDFVKADEDLWIVSRDYDYFEEIDKTVSLKPLLQREVSGRIGSGQVHCYTDLASFFEEFGKISSSRESAKLPDEKDIDEAKREIAFVGGVVSGSGHITVDRFSQDAVGHVGAVTADAPVPDYVMCPQSSGGRHDFSIRFAGPSQYGGWTEHVRCTRCGIQFDTGEPCDD